MKVAVVGAGISGLVSAYELAKSGVQVVVYEKDGHLDCHAKTVTINGVDLGLGFLIFDRLFGLPQLLTIRRRSHTYVNKVKEELEKRGCQIRTGCEVNSVLTNEEGYGFHENGLKVVLLLAGVVAADGMLRRNSSILYNHKHMVATQADLGLADAFIHGDFSFVDKNEGLLKLIMIFIANKDLNESVKTSSKKRGWWTPVIFTAALSSAKYFIWHVLNQNTLTQARRNISRHYDLSKDEDLKDAQLRKISVLIRKFCCAAACQTGCKYTGIILSKQQSKHAQLRVEQAGLQDQITLILCDYHKPQIRTSMTFISIQIRALGFDDKFIRTWQYYFDYCAAADRKHAR
ncbi:hypothetical protein HAX54_048866 [Datura stramonium]|uniref:Uncharacterized protein n=1 Tax=Datura stramonium TaxID=4076 RepID=A0ABS8WM56_DATST|nr:hypothetical protein [Datura stramonium]